MTKIVFIIANILFRYAYPVYRIVYYRFKNKQDSYEISLLKKMIKPGYVVLDIGANVGFYAELISDLVGPTGKVHAFEPDPVNYRHLKKSCLKKSNILANNLAVSDQSGELKLFTSNLLNVDHRTYPVDEYGITFTVKAESVDNYLKGKKVDFIKMDIQGAELIALKGMENTLENNQEIIILSEFWPYGLKQAGFSTGAFQTFLKSKGFRFYLLQEDKLLYLDELTSYAEMPEKNYYNLLLSRKEIDFT